MEEARKEWRRNKKTREMWNSGLWTPRNKRLIANPKSALYTSTTFKLNNVPRGFPLRLLAPGHKNLNKNNKLNSVPNQNMANAPSGPNVPNKNQTIQRRLANIRASFMNLTPSPFALFLAKEVWSSYSSLEAKTKSGGIVSTVRDFGKFIQMILRDINTYQSERRKNNVSSSQITAATRRVGVAFSDIHDVCIFLILIFCDYLHDLKTSKKTIVDLAHMLGIDVSRDERRMRFANVFRAWVRHVSWLNPRVKNEVLSKIANREWIVLLAAFGQKGDGMDESKLQRVFMQWMQSDSSGKLPFIFEKVSGIHRLRGGAVPHIAFDQSSKTSGPAFYAASKLSSKIDIALPMIADEGSGQPSNPYLEFRKHFVNLAHIYGHAIDQNSMRRAAEHEIIKMANEYVVNTNDTFEVNFTLGSEDVFGYTYYLTSASDIKVRFKTFGNQMRIDGPILSATGMAFNDPSVAILKTCADIGIIGYGIAAGSISTTGDRAASLTAMLLTYLNSRKRVVLRGSLRNTPLFTRNIFEFGPRTVIVSAYPRWTEGTERVQAPSSINFTANPFVTNINLPSNKLGVKNTQAAMARLTGFAASGFSVFAPQPTMAWAAPAPVAAPAPTPVSARGVKRPRNASPVKPRKGKPRATPRTRATSKPRSRPSAPPRSLRTSARTRAAVSLRPRTRANRRSNM